MRVNNMVHFLVLIEPFTLESHLDSTRVRLGQVVNGSFRFLNVWTRHPHLLQKVRDAWEKDHGGIGMMAFYKKLVPYENLSSCGMKNLLEILKSRFMRPWRKSREFKCYLIKRLVLNCIVNYQRQGQSIQGGWLLKEISGSKRHH